MAVYINTVHLLAYHIKTTTQLQSNHHSHPPEIELNGSLTTAELKKPRPSRLVRGVEMWNTQVPHLHVLNKNLGAISWKRRVPATHQTPSPGF